MELDNTSANVWADSARRSKDREAALRDDGWCSRIHRKGQNDKPFKIGMTNLAYNLRRLAWVKARRGSAMA